MKKLFLSSLLLLSLFNLNFAQAARPKQASPKAAANLPVAAVKQAAPVPVFNKTLSNGLEVIVYPDSGVPLVTVELAVRNGSFTEPPELNGLSHLYEHMFFKTNEAVRLLQCEYLASSGGSNPVCGDALRLKPKIGDVKYLNNIDSLGITFNGTTREEVVDYYFTTTSPYLSTAMRVINDSVRYPLFDETEFEQEKKVVIGEIDRNESNPYFYLNREMMDKLFYKYPTRKNPLGTRESVESATTDKMRMIESRYYVPNNSALVVAGDVKPEEVFQKAEELMGSWERRPEDPFKEFPLVEHPPLPKSSAVVIEKNTGEDQQSNEQNVFIQLGWQGPSIGKDDKSTYAADVFSYILTQPDSRFQRKLVDSGLASAVSIGYYTQRNVGPITIFLITTPDKAKAALKALYEEIAQFGSPNYFTNEELESSKTTLEANDLYDREKPSEYAHTLSFWWSSTGIDYFRGYQKNLNATSHADVDAYVNKYIIGKPHVGIAILSPDAKKQANLTDTDLIGQ
ncbi:MAG TPA: pitrilysin family protein [Pyrinomonadaceae bacterium]|nr:pitrilysin family protein [Pyrinomonadaceae bacterium]